MKIKEKYQVIAEVQSLLLSDVALLKEGDKLFSAKISGLGLYPWTEQEAKQPSPYPDTVILEIAENDPLLAAYSDGEINSKMLAFCHAHNFTPEQIKKIGNALF